MDKSILLLSAAGVVLVFLHLSTVVVTFGIIIALAMVATKLCWMIVQSFSQSNEQPVMQRRTAPVRNY